MVRWLIQDFECNHPLNRNLHSYFKHMIQLRKKGLDSAYWLGVSHESFSAFLSQANLSIESLGPITLRVLMREMIKSQLPTELKNQLRRALSEQKLIDSRVELELLVHLKGDPSFSLPWESICSISTKGLDGIYQGIKACWMAAFRSGIFNEISLRGISLNDLQVSIILKPTIDEQMVGKAYSFSPRCPWDRRHSVVSYLKGQDQLSFLIDRLTFRTSYYGRSIEDVDDFNNNSTTKNNSDSQINFAYDKIRKVAEFLQNCEKLLESSLQIDWVLSSDQRIHIKRINIFDRSPTIQQLAPQFNTSTRNIWDQSIINSNVNSLLLPFWFSLIPRNFRILSINYIKALGVKDKIPAEYEKVFRGFFGILRGRLYVNLGALHSYLGISESIDLAEEIEDNVSFWLKRYDRESRESWNFNWPQWPIFSNRNQKVRLNNINEALKKWPEKLSDWINQMHSLREVLVSSQWKEKSISSMIEVFQELEKKYIPTLVPILVAEIQFRNLLSWYYESSEKQSLGPNLDPSWTQSFLPGEKDLFTSTNMNWFSKRRKYKMLQQLEQLNQMRPKYISMLEDVSIKLRKFFELMGQKYQSLGQIEKNEDLFYLTLEEIVSFDEGRASTTSWKSLVSIRKDEYRKYASDLKVPETWFTTGLVGLAAQFPGIISIRDKKRSTKNPSLPSSDFFINLNELHLIKNDLNSQVISKSNSGPNINKLDFIEEEKNINSISEGNNVESNNETIG